MMKEVNLGDKELQELETSLEGFDEEKVLEDQMKGMKQESDLLKEATDLALYLASYVRVQRDQVEFMRLKRQLENDDVVYNRVVRQKKTQEALRAVLTDAKKLNSEDSRVQEEGLTLQAEIDSLIKN